MAHEGLGHARVHMIVGHMIAHSVCAPPEGEFAQVARADNHAVMKVRKPEEVARALACLNVLEGDVVDRRAFRKRMAYVLEHLHAAGPDIDLVGGAAYCCGEPPCLIEGAGACGESRHDAGVYVRSGKVHHVHCPGADDEGLGRVEAARDADDHMPGTRRSEPLHQPLHLDLVDLPAPLVLPLRIGGDKGEPLVRPLEEQPSPGGHIPRQTHRPEP